MSFCIFEGCLRRIMGIKVGRWQKIVMCGTGLIALSVLSGILGIHIERNRLNYLELQQEHISTVAVVNMDNGVTVGDEQVNYASQLISFPNENFTVTGLTDAKTGIENGSYAAYIVIPETFSASVTSIENDPRKVVLIYQYNYNLDEEAKIQAVNNVNDFIALLNSNIAYMYMDAIMAEFHRIQDDSATILSNDNREREILAGVNAAELIAAAESVEEISVDNDLRPVELAAYSAQNDILLDYMLSSYLEAVRQGKEDYAAIREESAGVKAAADNFFSAYEAVIQNTAAGQAQLLTTGRDKLAEAVGIYNQDLDAQEAKLKRVIVDVIDIQLEADQDAADAQLQEILDNLEHKDNDALRDLQLRWENAYRDAQSEAEKNLEQKKAESSEYLESLSKDIYVQGYNDALTDLSKQIDSLKTDVDSDNIEAGALQAAVSGSMLSMPLAPEVEEYLEGFGTAVREQLNSISVDWTCPDVALPSVSGNDPGDSGDIGDRAEIVLTAFSNDGELDNIVKKTLDLFKMESESEQINNTIQTYFVDALSEENERQMSGLSDAGTLLSRSMENYENSLAEYDPLQYIESANLSTYVNDIEANTGEMLHTVEQNNSRYMLYATEMYAAAQEHAAQVRSSLNEANTRTVQNVESCIDDLILSRETINSQNVRLLEGFTDSLKYTRVDSQGNAEVYDYIVNPVVSQSSGQAVAGAAPPVSKKGNPLKAVLVAVLGMGIVVCAAEVIINFRRQYKKA